METNTCHTHCLRAGLLLLMVPLVLAMLASPAMGQYYFGQNKVQYTNFDWQVMTTEHFRVYFYAEEAEMGRVAARLAEESYEELAARFNHEVTRKIPLIIYSAPAYFAQTNVLPQLLPESVAGFTEFLKGRVVVPFHGSYHDFDHVLRHELVHVFTYSKLDAVLDRLSKPRYAMPPLWFTEGLAEHWSTKWDTQADMIAKDMVISGRLIPIERMYTINGTYVMYKLGQSICGFIEAHYGPDKLLRLLENWHKGRTFDQIVKLTLGDDLKELSRKWEYSLKKKYFPEIEDLGLPKMESVQLTHSGYSESGIPLRWDDGDGEKDWIVFKANRMGYSGLYMKPANKSKDGIKTILKGERSGKFESLHLLRSGIDVTREGMIAFSSKSNESDVLNVYDLKKGKVTNRYRFDGLVSVRSPRFSPDSKSLVFTGIRKAGYSNLYLIDLETGDYRAITDDIYDDTDPTFGIDGASIVFASDRNSYGPLGGTNLFRLDLASGRLTQLTFGNFRDASPEATASGIYFHSDRLGTFNIFLLNNSGQITRQSTYVTGAMSPRLYDDGTRLVYTGFQDLSYQIYQMELAEEPLPVQQPVALTHSVWSPEKIDTEVGEASIKYESDFSFDIAQSSIAYDPVYGSVGGFQAAVSDVLGNEAFYFLLYNTAETRSELLSSFNAGVTYVNKTRQLNWGLGAFHLFYKDEDGFGRWFEERQAGGIALFSYPLSRFHRVEFTTVARYNKKDRYYGLEDREGFLITNYLRWVYDNSIWDYTGPIEGRRYNISLGITTSLEKGLNYNRIALGDIRHYFRLGRYSAFANRLFAYTSNGLEPERIYLGGSWSFRGFSRRHFYNRNILFASNELRFPLIDDLLIGFPIGDLGFRGIRGALFFDVGTGWEDEFDQFYGSFGAGFRVNVGYVVVLRFDFARTTDFETISSNTDFDFFFGWNF